MTWHALLSFLSCLVCVGLGTGLVARDPGLRVNRLVGAIPISIGWWGLCQTLWSLESDPERVLWWVRLSGLGWMSLGSLCFHALVETAGPRARSLEHWPRRLYAITVPVTLFYVTSPWFTTHVTATWWGWAYHFGPLFPAAYLTTGLPVVAVLVNWRHVEPEAGSRGERRVSRALFVGVCIGLVGATLTDVGLPLLGAPVPQLALPLLTSVMVAVAIHFRRFGYSMLSARAYSGEILESLRDGVVLLRPDGRIREANQAFARLAGVPEEDLRDRPVSRWIPDLGQAGGTAEAGPERERRLLAAEGPAIPVRVDSCAIVRGGRRVLGSALVVRDQRDLAELREQLITSGRLAVVGELSAGIAHEIREPVLSARSDLDRLRKTWRELDQALRATWETGGAPDAAQQELLAEAEELIDECVEGVERVAAIVRDVGGLAPDESSPLAPVEVAPSLLRALRMVRSDEHPDARIETDLAPGLWVAGSAAGLEQVWINLIQNALHAVRGRGWIRIATAATVGGVEVRVEDDGYGIESAVRDRIFDPFFTTKPVGEGTGLGLAISYHIVSAHRGRIRAGPRNGGGSVFCVELPRVEPGHRNSSTP